jgi:Protein of unknown function (DUF3073).
MGRGRAKAKQTKVARELKYSSPTMDLDALQREIGSGTVPQSGPAPQGADVDDDYADPYAPDADEDEDSPQRRYR